MSLESNGVDRVRKLRKIPRRLLWHELFHQVSPFCTEFCNATERCQLHINSIKHYETWVLGSMGRMGTFVAKNSDTTSWGELLHHFGRFAPCFVRQPNGTKCNQIVRNAPKYEFRSQRGQSGAFTAKNSDATSWHELLHQFSLFWTECYNATNYPKCTQIVWNATKHEVRVQWGGSSGLLWKIPTRLHGTKFCTTSARFAPSFVR